MKIVSNEALAIINQRQGTEPINFISIRWSEDNIKYYGDKAIAPDVSAKIISLGGLDEVLRITSGSTSASVSVTLDDTDNTIRDLLEIVDVHKRECVVYQTYEGLDRDKAFEIFRGEMVSPIEWDECKRTFQFNIFTEIDSEEAGFAPEEGQFDFMTDDAVGKVWPLCFGECVHVPAVKSSSVISSVTTTEVGYPDVTLLVKRNVMFGRILQYIFYINYMKELLDDTEGIARQVELIQADYIALILEEDPLKQDIEDETKEIETLINKLDNDDLTDAEIASANVERTNRQATLEGYETRFEQLQTLRWVLDFELSTVEYKQQVQKEIRDKIVEVREQYVNANRSFLELKQSIDDQSSIVINQVKVLNGEKFPQNQDIELLINGVVVSGQFDGDIFNIDQYKPQHTNVVVGTRLDDDPKSFWLSDSSVDLTGFYVLTNSGYVLKVNNQVGNRCYIDLRESQVVRYNEVEEVAFTELDLGVWSQLDAASEHTDGEKERILEQALGDDSNGQALLDLRTSITDRTDKLKENLGSLSKDQVSTVREVLYKDMFKYNRLISQTKVPLSATQKINQKITQDEEDFLLRCRNLAFLRDQQAQRPLTVSIDNAFINGFQADSGIAAASKVIFGDWLPGLDIEGAPPSTLWISQPGTPVSIVGFKETYIANILPSEVSGVFAKRAINGKEELVPVPSSYYTVYPALELDNLTCTGIELRQPLTSYANENWSEGLYVTLKSSVGPNTADIIKHIAETYTDLTVDELSYDNVRDRLENYPSNFALFNKRDAVNLIEDIAWQARCVVWAKAGKLYFKYLAEVPSIDIEINAEDIEEETLVISTTSTEDLYTKLTGTWKPHYFVQEPNKSIIRHNIARYKSIEFEREFFIYNIQSLVEKSLTFWAIRYSNSWKRVKFTTFMTNIQLEPWDTISLYIPSVGFCDDAVRCIVDRAEYDSANCSITVEAWTPVRTGTKTVYDFAHPADLPIETEFPTPDDVAAGNAGNPRNYPNDSNGNSGGLQPLVIRPRDFGANTLSDGGDTVPVSPISGYQEVSYRQFDVKPSDIPANKQLNRRVAAAWGFNSNLNGPTLKNTKPFKGYVDDYIDLDLGVYVVKNSRGQAIRATYERNQPPLKQNRVVIATYDTRLHEWNISPINQRDNIVNITAINADTLTCETITQNKTITVMKPYSLRRTPFDNQTVNGIDYVYSTDILRVATGIVDSVSVDEIQMVTPDYVVGDSIVIHKMNAPVTVGTDNHWFKDKNVDARVWAVEII